jgi:deoxyribose-phosphate aldolase
LLTSEPLRRAELLHVEDDISAVVAAAQGWIVKVILENGYLDDDQRVLGCRLTEDAGARFVNGAHQ